MPYSKCYLKYLLKIWQVLSSCYLDNGSLIAVTCNVNLRNKIPKFKVLGLEYSWNMHNALIVDVRHGVNVCIKCLKAYLCGNYGC